MADKTAALQVTALRELADWLEQHPGETVMFGVMRLHAEHRDDLERIAEAFGESATEAIGYGGTDVVIAREFGLMKVNASLPLRHLQPEAPPAPEYDRIIQVPAHA